MGTSRGLKSAIDKVENAAYEVEKEIDSLFHSVSPSDVEFREIEGFLSKMDRALNSYLASAQAIKQAFFDLEGAH